MTTDILTALSHLIYNSSFVLPSSAQSGVSKPVTAGDRFEDFCKDWLSELKPGDVSNRESHYHAAFCYRGSANNPPDAMYRGGNDGDAFEFKKHENKNASSAPNLELNSSSPKDMLLASNPRLTKECIECEKWDKRSFYYIIGNVPPRSERVSSLWVVDGRLLAADSSFYLQWFNGLKAKVDEYLQEIGHGKTETKEIGRISNIDPLNRSTLRVRSMWELEHPASVFKTVDGVQFPEKGNSVLHALILQSQWDNYSIKGKEALLDFAKNKKISITNLEIASPCGEKNLSVKLIRFES
ncbi:NgoPII family restriction endonuclease [Alphaproteobacteria bacterium]|jgi:hypothetical protein|nr:NgoPII family restriction endonuclease [Alphaproteobacteria bacterium]MDC0395088.1 NgoPII family restriction endonuclease [Alphaproteobacteria bacterium]MDC3311369.1 NgoPII family restriction endonuclease [Alphaproteobacteria bacterium]